MHEVTPDGQVYFGANSDAGNTDETAKFPSTVALVWRWTGDDAFRDEMYALQRPQHAATSSASSTPTRTAGRRVSATSSVTGMGEEKLDNTVYTIRGLRDLADLAASKGDRATAGWATTQGGRPGDALRRAWWYGPAAQQYADSLDDPGNVKVFQRHWIGVTPAEAEIKRPGRPNGPLAPRRARAGAGAEARGALLLRAVRPVPHRHGCHHRPEGNPGATCDSATSDGPGRAVGVHAEHLDHGGRRGGAGPDGHGAAAALHHRATPQVQLDPSVWEIPGAMPEIAPSPDFGANIEKLFTERSMALQAWGTYGILWPVVHYQLGVSPDAGRSRVRVVPQVPKGQSQVSGRNVRVGSGAVAVSASRSSGVLRTVVHQDRRWALTIGAVLPTGAKVASVRLDGRRHELPRGQHRSGPRGAGLRRPRPRPDHPASRPPLTPSPTRRECTIEDRRVGASARMKPSGRALEAGWPAV